MHYLYCDCCYIIFWIVDVIRLSGKYIRGYYIPKECHPILLSWDCLINSCPCGISLQKRVQIGSLKDVHCRPFSILPLCYMRLRSLKVLKTKVKFLPFTLYLCPSPNQTRDCYSLSFWPYPDRKRNLCFPLYEQINLIGMWVEKCVCVQAQAFTQSIIQLYVYL